MSSQKTIKINPDLFKLNHTSKKRDKKPKKERPIIQVKPNQVKKELLNKIKEYQKRNEEKGLEENRENRENISESERLKNKIQKKSFQESQNKNKDEETTDEGINEFNQEFNKSLNFLQGLSKSINEKKKEKTLKRRNQHENRVNKEMNVITNVNLELPSELCPEMNKQPKIELTENFKEKEIQIDTKQANNGESKISEDKIKIPYGCLKNGSKPTFREWKRETQKIRYKNTSDNSISNLSSNVISCSNSSTNSEFIKKDLDFNKVANDIEQFNLNKNKNKNKNKNLKILEKNTRVKKYKLGKLGKQVSILIKNNETRKKIREDYTKLKKTNILDVKNYLRKHNLFKVGNDTPNDLLRQTYEQAVLSGEINNLSKENLLHNYFTN